MSSKRIVHYEHLLDFVQMLGEGVTEICRELLLFDTYSRENMKTLPSFAKKRDGDKDFLRGFYQKEETTREYLPDYEGYDSKQLAKMTHVEFFRYPVWDKDMDWISFLQGEAEFDSGIKEIYHKTDIGYGEKEQAVLFDYRHRDFVTKGCRIVLLQEKRE